MGEGKLRVRVGEYGVSLKHGDLSLDQSTSVKKQECKKTGGVNGEKR